MLWVGFLGPSLHRHCLDLVFVFGAAFHPLAEFEEAEEPNSCRGRGLEAGGPGGGAGARLSPCLCLSLGQSGAGLSSRDQPVGLKWAESKNAREFRCLLSSLKTKSRARAVTWRGASAPPVEFWRLGRRPELWERVVWTRLCSDSAGAWVRLQAGCLCTCRGLCGEPPSLPGCRALGFWSFLYLSSSACGTSGAGDPEA